MSKAPAPKPAQLAPLCHAALLVIDMQERFRPLAAPLLGDVNATIDLCHEMGAPVVFTLHGHPWPDTPEGAADAGSALLRWWGANRALRIGTDAWQLLPELHVGPADVLLSKRSYDAFHGTGLLGLLRRAGVGAVAVAGVHSNCCCETTARAAQVLNLGVAFLSDGTAAMRPDLHAATLLNVGFGVGRVLTCAQLRQELLAGASEAAQVEQVRGKGG